jgi:hypothetical protein
MIILNENERAVVSNLFRDAVGEDLVDFAISIPVFVPKDGAPESNVAQWPESGVRKPVVVVVLLLPTQPDALESVGWPVRRHFHEAVFVGCFAICDTAAVSDPQAVADSHDGVESHGDAPDRPNPIDPSLFVYMHVRFAVGDNDEFVATKPGL